MITPHVWECPLVSRRSTRIKNRVGRTLHEAPITFWYHRRKRKGVIREEG